MGLFNGYLKEGPGVEKDAPEKHRFFLFFELFGRKFSKLILLNIMYFVTLVPLIIGAFSTFAINENIYADGAISYAMIKTYPPVVFSGNILGMIIFLIGFIIAGASTCGFVYVIRNYQNQEHAWLKSDFIEQFKLNFRQGATIGIIDFIMIMMVFVATNFYLYMAKSISPEFATMSPILLGVVSLITIVYTWMHYYMHLLMVTFDISTKDIYKNAFLFSIGKLPLNLLITVIVAVIVLICLFYIPIRISIIMTGVILLSFIGYIITFSVYPTVEKYMIKGN